MIKLGLSNVKTAAAILGNPQDSFKSIHVTGTNGKGSVCTWLELMLLSLQGVRQHDETIPRTIGKYISPHLISVTERISVNGKDISEEDFGLIWAELFGGSYDTNAYQSEIQDPQARLYGQSLTEFEKLTLLAFEHFKRAGVNLGIIEVGLGGRLDATNILSPEHCLATAITNIGLDHQDYLGNTIEEITKEKRGIMKPSVPHYEGMLTAQAPNDIQGSNFLLAKQIFEAITDSSLKLSSHCEERSDEAIPCTKHGDPFASLGMTERFNQRYKARFDESQPGLIIDGAHNPDGAKELNRYLRNKYPSQPKIWIIGMLDKDHESFLDNLFYKLLNPELDQIIFTRVNNSRSKDPQVLKEYILTIYPNIRVLTSNSLTESLWDSDAANTTFDNKNRHREEHSDEAIPQEITIITGSLYLCGEIISKKLS